MVYLPTSSGVLTAYPLRHSGARSELTIQFHELQPEIIIVGGGVAGCALAYSLSHAGRKCVMIERDLSEPDRIVGELLQPGGVRALEQLGLASTLEGIDATPVEGYCVISGDREVPIPYPDLPSVVAKANGKANGHANGKVNGHANGNGAANGKANGFANGSAREWVVQSSSGRKEGRSFHHGRFIQALRSKCINDAPNVTVVEATVRDLIFCPHTNQVIGVSAAPKAPAGSDAPAEVQKIYAPLTIIADGCFSKFRSAPGTRTPTPLLRSHFVGVIIKDVDLPIKHHGTVCLTPEGPVLLYQIGDRAREIRMLVDIKGKLPSVADGSLKRAIIDRYLPHLPPTLHESIFKALDEQRLRTMPNSFLPPSMQGLADSLQGAILVGDAWNMRHPLTGGGMTVAFHDAVLLTKYLRPDAELIEGREGMERWDVIADRLKDWFWARKGLAGTVNVLSIALYDLFGAADDDLAVLREGCFKYFELGGECVAGPVGLLSALAPRPVILFYHFFSVAFYSIYILFSQGVPAPKGQVRVAPSWLEVPGLFLFSFKVFWTACVVFLPVMYSEFRI
jgi:squalene monooxygenase